MNGDLHSRVSSRFTCYWPLSTTDILESINKLHCHNVCSCTSSLPNPQHFSTLETLGKSKRFRASQPYAIAQKSCHSTEDLINPTELPNMQCDKPHGASSTKEQPALQKNSTIIPDNHTNSIRACPCICIFCIDSALRLLEFNSIEARKLHINLSA